MRRWSALAAVFAALVICGLATCGSGYGGGYAPVGEVVSPFTVEVDTFELLVTDYLVPNRSAQDTTDANDVPWIRPNDKYDVIEDDQGSLRYGYVQTGATSGDAKEFAWGGYSTRRGEDDNVSDPTYTMFLWVDTSSIPDDYKIEESFVILPVMRAQTMSMGSTDDYVSLRADTVSTDYAALATTSQFTDPQLLDIAFDYVDATAQTAWTKSLSGRDDMHDYGPRSETVYWANRAGGTTDRPGGLVRFDVTDAVQQIVDRGEQSRGIMFVAHATTGVLAGGTPNMVWGFGDSYADVPMGNPAFTCKATSYKGERAWGGIQTPVVLTFDDNYDDHIGYFDALTDSGLVFTEATTALGMANVSFDSLNSANQGEIDFLHHSLTHPSLGDLTGAAVDVQLARDFFMDSQYFTDPPDTSRIIDFAWPASTGTNDGIEPMLKMVTYDYRSARSTSRKWSDGDGVGLVTYPAWSGYVNMFQVATLNASVLFEDLAEPDSIATQATILEEFEDYTDLLYTDHGKAAFVLYIHKYDSQPTGFGEHLTNENLRWFIGMVNARNHASFMSYREMVTARLTRSPYLDPADVVTASGGSTVDATPIATSAAMHDSIQALGGVNDNAGQWWVGPK